MFSLRFASCSQPGVEGATPSQPGSRVLRLLLLLAVTTGVEAATLTSLDVGGGGEEPVEVALPEHELKRHIRLHPENAYPALYERKPGFIVDTGVIFTEPVEITSHHNTKIDAAKSILRQQSVIPSTERFGILAGPGIYVAWDDQWVPRSRQLSGEDEGTFTRMAFTQYPVKAILFICAEYWDVDQRNQRNPIGSATPAELLSQYDLIVLVKCHLQFPEGGEPPKALFAQLGLIPPGKESTIPSDHKHIKQLADAQTEADEVKRSSEFLARLLVTMKAKKIHPQWKVPTPEELQRSAERIAALNAQRKAEKEKPKKDDLHSTVEAVRDEGAPALNEG